MAKYDESLYKTLKDLQVIDGSKLDSIYKEAQESGSDLYDALLDRDMISDENLGGVIADIIKLPFVSLAKTSIDPVVLRLVPESIARASQIVGFSATDKEINIAICDITPLELVNNLAKKISLSPVLHFATKRDVQNAMSLYDVDMQERLNNLLKEVGTSSNKDTIDAPVTEIVDILLQRAYHTKSSDIHLETGKRESHVRFRIDGILHDMLVVPKNIHSQIIARIKVMAKLRTDEHLSAQDGKLQFHVPEEDRVDVRVSIVPTTEGEGAVMRILSSKSRQFSLIDLGMVEKDLQKVTNGFQKPYGMILSTGPTGSGKTTTMYSILKILNSRSRNIDTIEDPVEYEISGINHIQVNPKTNLTFAEGLRSILRQDPDVIFVGEIRDKETAEIAVNAALTGHLVLSTLHTNDAATSLPRLIDMDVEPFVVSSSVNVIVAQRLVRKICEKCKVSYTQNSDTVAPHFSTELAKKFFPSGVEQRFYKGKGCAVCHDSGFAGRIGIFEVLEVTDQIKEKINKRSDAKEIRDTAIAQGMTTMMEDGLGKMFQGLTTLEEILRTVKE